MEISAELCQQIITLLTSLPNIHSVNGRRALVLSASLDKALENQVLFEGTATQFCQLLVTALSHYSTLKDGHPALQAILEVVKNQVGLEGKTQCDMLIQALASKPSKFSKTLKVFSKIEEPVMQADEEEPPPDVFICLLSPGGIYSNTSSNESRRNV